MVRVFYIYKYNFFFSAQRLLLQMLDKKSERRISLKQICLSKWFTSHYKWNHQGTFLGSTKDEDLNASNTFLELTPNTCNAKNKQKSSKLSLFSFNNNNCKNSFELSLSAEDENFNLDEGKINMKNYNLNPKFFECGSFMSSSNENNGCLGINECSITKNMAKKSFCFLEVCIINSIYL